MTALEQETIYYAAATLLTFGGPALAFLAYLKFDDIKHDRAVKERADKEFLEKNGQEAYNQMLKRRSANKANVFAAAVNTPIQGVWYSLQGPDQILELVEANYADALIGSAPHRLSELECTGPDEISLSGQWPYPRNPQMQSMVILNLQIKPLADGRTAVNYKYRIAPGDDPFAKQIVEITNFWLKDLIEKAR